MAVCASRITQGAVARCHLHNKKSFIPESDRRKVSMSIYEVISWLTVSCLMFNRSEGRLMADSPVQMPASDTDENSAQSKRMNIVYVGIVPCCG